MGNAYVSFYLKQNRIHIFVDSLKAIGSPKRICIMVSSDGMTLLIAPYDKRDLKSHKIPDKVYNGGRGKEISSKKLCTIIAEMFHWDKGCSYRVPCDVKSMQHVLILHMNSAEKIESTEFEK